jgi:DNA-binding transcriptional LysR family regulator
MHIFTESTDSVMAAALGLGAALTRSRIGAPYLRSGQVVRLPGPALRTRFAYYAVYPSHRRPTPAVTAFIEWLEDEARADKAPS